MGSGKITEKNLYNLAIPLLEYFVMGFFLSFYSQII